MQRLQAQVADKLDADRLARYIAMRDARANAVRLSNAGRPEGGRGRALEACAARLPDVANDPELDDLARLWLHQAWAYFDVRRGDPAAAEAAPAPRDGQRHPAGAGARLRLMHIGRIHTVQLWLRVQVAGGAQEAALDGANAILAYVNGFGGDLPLGAGWSKEAASRIPADLAAAMTYRVADEVGTILGGLDQEHSARALDRLTALDRLAPDLHDEIADWARIKRAWSEGFVGRVPGPRRPLPGRRSARDLPVVCGASGSVPRRARATPGPGRRFCADVAESARGRSRGATRAA